MMALTHAAIAATGVSFILSSTNPLILGLAIVGSQLPDIDSSSSLIGQICFPLSHWLEDRYPHRTVTHSLLATAFLTICGVCAWQFVREISLGTAIALPLGHLLAVFSDTFTKQGVQLFFPMPVWCVCGSNPRRRLKTGGTGEYWVLALAIALLAISFQFATGGGIVPKVSQQLGLKDAIIQTYNEKAGKYHLWAEVEAVKASDRSDASGRYFIADNVGSEFILLDGDKTPYKTGDHLIVSKMTVEEENAAETELKTIQFNDEDLLPKLQQLASKHAGSLVLLSGSIQVDFPEDVAIELQPDQLQALSVTGSNLNFDNCPVEKAIATISDQWAIGQLTVKIVKPSPFTQDNETTTTRG